MGRVRSEERRCHRSSTFVTVIISYYHRCSVEATPTTHYHGFSHIVSHICMETIVLYILHCTFLILIWFKPTHSYADVLISAVLFVVLQKRHHVLQTVHPSPLSAHRGFFGCKHFSKTNELLLKSGKKPIDWKTL